jgi:hypothetical protein
MADIDLKTETPDASLPADGFLFGADSQAAASPSVYTTQSVATRLLGSTTLSGTTITANAPVLDLAQTWNNAAVTFTGAKLNVTDTASNAASLLMDLQVGGVSRVRINKTGAIVNTLNTFGTSNFTLRGGDSQNFGVNIQGQTLYFQSSTNVGAALRIAGSAGDFGVSNTGMIGFHTTFPGADAIDAMITRKGAANLRLGAPDAASPVAQTLSVQGVVAGTTNTAGASLTIAGSQGTGTGAGGSIVFQVAPAGSSGTAQNALATALTINSAGQSEFAAGSKTNPTIKFSALAGGFYGRVGGILTATNGSIEMWQVGSTTGMGVNTQISLAASGNDWSTAGGDVVLARDAANTLALRNGTNAQTFRVYNTESSSLANFERLSFIWNSNLAIIRTESAGTGVARELVFGTGGGAQWFINTSGHFGTYGSDNVYDIGASGGNRPRNLFLGSYAQLSEMTAPAAPAANGVRIYAVDNGSGKTQLMALFATGAAQQIAIEP